MSLVSTSQLKPVVKEGGRDGWMDDWTERKEGMKRKLTDDARAVLPVLGDGRGRARGGGVGARAQPLPLRAPPTRGIFVFFL